MAIAHLADEHKDSTSLEKENTANGWLKAVSENNPKRAIQLATKMIPKRRGKLVNSFYQDFGKREGIGAGFFDRNFDEFDFDLWRSAYFFHHLAREITDGELDKIDRLHDAVVQKIAGREKKEELANWPFEIWRRGYGVCDRQAWVMSELAYQCGWEHQIVYLFNPKTKVSPHTICEIRKEGIVHLSDPFHNVFLEQASVASISKSESTLLKIWPDHPNYREAIKGSRFWTPSFPQDYRIHNQQLYIELKKVLGDRCPRFGIDPDLRMATYRNLWPTKSEEPQFEMELWPIPFRVIRRDARARYHNAKQ